MILQFRLGPWTMAGTAAPARPGQTARLDALSCLAAAGLILATFAQTYILPAVQPVENDSARLATATGPLSTAEPYVNERLFAFYIAQPFYYRSNVHFVRNDDTDVVFKKMGWDGDALMPPIDGGVRVVKWRHNLGFMIDFLHNKAVSRLGKGAHGRKIASPIIETVEVEGRIAGKPAPKELKLTDFFERFEFTHGHNVLIATPMARLGEVYPGVRPYFGIGAGVAIPHVEVWYPGQDKATRTNEYQYAGPATQLLAGLELRHGNISYFLEYKFSYAWIAGSLTGDQSWMNFNMPGDLLRQFRRWLSGEPAKEGHFETTLGAHQIATGIGYWIKGRQPAPAP
mgnify:CR=1 FL=1